MAHKELVISLALLGLVGGCSASVAPADTTPSASPARTITMAGSGSGAAGTVFAEVARLLAAPAVGAVVLGTVGEVRTSAGESLTYTTYDVAVTEVSKTTSRPVGKVITVRELGGTVTWDQLPQSTRARLVEKDPSAQGATLSLQIPAGATAPVKGDEVVLVLWRERDPDAPDAWTPLMGAGGRFTKATDGSWKRAGVEAGDESVLTDTVLRTVLPAMG